MEWKGQHRKESEEWGQASSKYDVTLVRAVFHVYGSRLKATAKHVIE